LETTSILIFSGVAALLTITPGADMALVTSKALTSGRRAALATTLGINTGVLTWAAASALGIAALIAASTTAFAVLKLAGGVYLIVLGVLGIWRTRHRPGSVGTRPGLKHERVGRSYRQGLVTNLLNPKIAVFYTTLLPQFIVPGDPVLLKSLLLAGIHNLMGLAWLAGYAWLVTRAGELLRRSSVRTALDRLTGAVLITLGVRLAIEKR
jgi:threonine/homoserine/homoserine lactone efflux protein